MRVRLEGCFYFLSPDTGVQEEVEVVVLLREGYPLEAPLVYLPSLGGTRGVDREGRLGVPGLQAWGTAPILGELVEEVVGFIEGVLAGNTPQQGGHSELAGLTEVPVSVKKGAEVQNKVEVETLVGSLEERHSKVQEGPPQHHNTFLNNFDFTELEQDLVDIGKSSSHVTAENLSLRKELSYTNHLISNCHQQIKHLASKISSFGDQESLFLLTMEEQVRSSQVRGLKCQVSAAEDALQVLVVALKRGRVGMQEFLRTCGDLGRQKFLYRLTIREIKSKGRF